MRGAAPGTRETDLLDPVNMVERIHALVLAGGSAYGLESASGVMACLEEENIGFQVGPGLVVPIVPAAVIFDLSVGNPRIRPTKAWGYKACKSANDSPVKSGNIGAGLGATVGKILGQERAMKGGLGSFVMDLPGGIQVGAIVVVNAFGDVVDPETGEINARLSKIQLRKVAQMSHNGLARAIRPAHTLFDGDTVFAVSIPRKDLHGDPGKNLMTIAVAAEKVLEKAILLAVERAETTAGIPASHDWK
uniref:L-aminopeptidase/D-esterase n=1 Tax=Candidatus Kentrum sp. TUN TaxID=2126343 RepID=A0A451AVX1_9GAMM|nr:MAG: L-aminopeptidase/D-esterase [Candidatus Kentron sp. TUN]VFK61123.1 MAG: L-aminopeptidase/D-esterase [Candidatus Kentron sp. TUN]VFK70206.1 MAG: L-aminopeptidase/D-esterase [Candidatus Kentron sp. TUN]